MKRPGASMGIGTPVEAGNCSCCAKYKGASLHIWDPDYTAYDPPAKKGELWLKVKATSDTEIYEVDVTPIYGLPCFSLHNDTFTLDIISGGTVIGEVTYEGLGSVFPNVGTGNLTVRIEGHVYKIQNGNTGVNADGIRFYESSFTEIDGEPV